jgi:DNA topoisomerase IA
MSGLKVLCVAEKPSVARALCDILRQRPNSSSQSLSSRSHINSITQITVPFLPNIHSNGPVHVIVTSVLGHVYRKDFPSDYNNWNNIDPETLFSAPIVSLTPPNSEGLVENLKHLGSQIDELWLWLDCDREGEAIADEVRTIVLSGAHNRRAPRIRRAIFNALTQDQVEKAISNLKLVDERAVQAANTRSELDLRLGAVFTRFQSLLLANRPKVYKVLSYGSCQVPTLKIVVQRYLEHYTFRPCTFWYLQCLMANENDNNEENNQIDDEDNDLDSIRRYRSSLGGAAAGGGVTAGGGSSRGNSNQSSNHTNQFNNSLLLSKTTQFSWSRPNFFKKDSIDLIHESLHSLKPQVKSHHVNQLKTFFSQPSPSTLPPPPPSFKTSPNLYQPNPLTVVSCVEANSAKYRPVPMTTLELQQFACRKLGLTSQEAMDTAEKLYHEGFLSYPRTETDSFPRDMELEMKEIIFAFANTPAAPPGNHNMDTENYEAYRNYAASMVNFQASNSFITVQIDPNSSSNNNNDNNSNSSENPPSNPQPQSIQRRCVSMTDKYRFPRSGKKNDQAHPPIHPKKPRSATEWASDPDCIKKRKVYDYVTRHFLACCSQDALGKRTTAILQCPITSESFKGEAISIVARNFLDIAPWERWYAKTLPPLTPGTQITPAAIIIKQGTTTGPSLHTESSLLKAMDENGIGTDATMASHITTLRTRGYMFPGSVLPTPLGCGLVLGWALRCPLLVSIKVRREMETALEQVAKGEIQAEKVKNDQLRLFRQVFDLISLNHVFQNELKQAVTIALNSPVQIDVMNQLGNMPVSSNDHFAPRNNNNNNDNDNDNNNNNNNANSRNTQASTRQPGTSTRGGRGGGRRQSKNTS